MVERRPGHPRDLLEIWMEWEKGETTPGKVMSELKQRGMRELLDQLVEQAGDAEQVEGVPGAETGGDATEPAPGS